MNTLLRFATQWIAIAPDQYMDERQEAVRNTAYRLSHRVLAIAFGIPAWLMVSYITSKNSGSPADGAATIGLIVTYLELLYFTPTAIIAWLESDAVADEEDIGFRLPGRVLVTIVLIVLAVLSPLLVSVTLAAPAHGSAWTQLRPVHGENMSCRYVQASEEVGMIMSATLRMNGLVCWDGKPVWRSWGMSPSDCRFQRYDLTSPAFHCTVRHLQNGALDVRYDATVRSPFLPAVGRHIALHLLLGTNGKVRALTRRVTVAPLTVPSTSRHLWQGSGSTAEPLHVSMPTGGIPLVSSNPWRLRFRFTCSGLHHQHGLPPHYVGTTTFSMQLQGGSWGRSGGSDSSYNTDRGSQSFSMNDGGSYTMSISALPTCRWTVEAR
jgi:hypothetical protein